MSKDVGKSPPTADPTVDCLVPCSSIRLDLLIDSPLSCRHLEVLESISVAAVGNNLLSRAKELDDSAPSNLQVRVASSQKGYVGPYNPTHLNGNSDLVPSSRPVQFVGEPLRAEQRWLSDGEVCAVKSDLAVVSIVVHKPIIEADLQRRKN
jgi:hypothetical protein